MDQKNIAEFIALADKVETEKIEKLHLRDFTEIVIARELMINSKLIISKSYPELQLISKITPANIRSLISIEATLGILTWILQVNDSTNLNEKIENYFNNLLVEYIDLIKDLDKEANKNDNRKRERKIHNK